jgi:hypothetical protein
MKINMAIEQRAIPDNYDSTRSPHRREVFKFVEFL